MVGNVNYGRWAVLSTSCPHDTTNRHCPTLAAAVGDGAENTVIPTVLGLEAPTGRTLSSRLICPYKAEVHGSSP